MKMKFLMMALIGMFIKFTLLAEEPKVRDPVVQNTLRKRYPEPTKSKNIAEVGPLGCRYHADYIQTRYREIDGYAAVDGVKVHFFLYDTYTNYNGDIENKFLRIYLPEWVELLGYIIDWESQKVYSYPHQNVKKLMTENDRDLAVAIIFQNPPILLWEGYDKDDNTWQRATWKLVK